MMDNTIECRITYTDAFTEFNKRAERSREYREFDEHEGIYFGPYFLNSLTVEGLRNPLHRGYEVKE